MAGPHVRCGDYSLPPVVPLAAVLVEGRPMSPPPGVLAGVVAGVAGVAAGVVAGVVGLAGAGTTGAVCLLLSSATVCSGVTAVVSSCVLATDDTGLDDEP